MGEIWNSCHFIFVCFLLFTLWIKLTVSTNVSENTTCYCLVEELSNLRNPVHVEATRIDDEETYLIAEQIGVIWKYRPKVKSKKLNSYLNVTDLVSSEYIPMDEYGLLGFALHPNFTTNMKIYLYTIRALTDRDVKKPYAVISEITGNNLREEKILLAIEQPGTKRNGGQLLFDSDGFLYIFVGDGGPEKDSNIQAQNGSSLLGKVLRINVDKSTIVDFRPRYYDIPIDNPMKIDWRPEVYAIGGRNMWRCGLDKGDENGKGRGRIFCGDLGSSLADEINEIRKGGNYGWPNWEGSTCRREGACKDSNNIPPLFEARHDTGNIKAIVGGPLYRQNKFPHLKGQLIIGDFVSASVYTLKETLSNDGASKWNMTSFPFCDKTRCGCKARDVPRSFLLSFGETHTDELLLLMTNEPSPHKPSGAMLRLEPPSGDHVTCKATNLFSTTMTYHFVIIFLTYFCISL